ncbi:hypothetical protein NHJ13734_005835 [Beauveria thailandica]
MLPLSFTECVGAGITLVAKQYPEAKLLEALCTAPQVGYVNSPSEFTNLGLVFQANDGTWGSVRMNTTNCADFGLQYDPNPVFEDVAIPWPIEKDAVQADHHLKELSTSAYDSMLLRWPLYPGDDEPYYIFHLEQRVGMRQISAAQQRTRITDRMHSTDHDSSGKHGGQDGDYHEYKR